MDEIERKKELLWRYRDIWRQIRRMDAELKEMRLLRMCPSSSKGDGMPRSSGKHDLSDYIVQLDEQISRLLRKRAEAAEALNQIIDWIDTLPDEDEREVLWRRYISGQRWEDISGQMGCSARWAHKLHFRALNHLMLKI